MLSRRIRAMVRNFPENGMKFLLENPLNVRDLLGLANVDWLDQLDWPQARLEQTTFIQRDYRHVESDVVLRVPWRTPRRGRAGRSLVIYLLIEHQSEPDRWMSLRMLDYVLQIYKTQLRVLQRRRTEATDRLPLVFPVVFYTGAQPWPEIGEFADLVIPADRLQERIPGLTPLYLNLNALPAAHLETGGGFFGWLLRLVRARQARPAPFRELLEQVVAHLETMPTTERTRWLELLSYIHALVYHGRAPAEHADLQQRIADSVQTDPHRQEVYQMSKTIADSLIEKGRREGRRKGREEGREEGRSLEAVTSRQQILMWLLAKKFGAVPDAVVQALQQEARIATLDGWIDKLIDAKSLEELGIPES